MITGIPFIQALNPGTEMNQICVTLPDISSFGDGSCDLIYGLARCRALRFQVYANQCHSLNIWNESGRLNGKPVVVSLLENHFEKEFSRPFPKLLCFFYYELRTYVFKAKESITEKFLPSFFQKAAFDLSFNRKVQIMTMWSIYNISLLLLNIHKVIEGA